MRVIHISPTAFGVAGLFGGGERYPVELARALARHIDCKLVTFGQSPSTIRGVNPEITVLRPLAFAGGHPAHPVSPALLRELAGADIVHVHHLRALPSRVAAVAAVGRGQRRVVTDHGLGRGRWPSIDHALFDRYLPVSRYSARTLHAPPEKTTVIYGGADINRFHPTDDNERSGVLFVGRLTPHKGVERLISCLPQGATLTVAGTHGHDPDGPERYYDHLLRRVARGRDVCFVGAVPEENLPKLYRSARVVVLPSVKTTYYGKHIAIPELLGLTLLEAMASGTPVIASDVGGLPEVVVDGETGFVVRAEDDAELRSRVEQLLTDDALLKKMSGNARAHIVDNFTWERVAERCLSVYSELIGAP